ncbi:KpsF/GutQ family sugar-phosphate isomerase [Leucobacter tenebrionis]|uniref:KpsF/GutQ family sugar-phosphate isomerase n=1 Tax=Leucobacter tenebrionis TaxID=2873270 RepID=UPI001CA6877E|nr:SIS domain-containing protein [Leucobacter tenebrionis]QZY52953.1 SIS domain-containing protein [Leucobacter tenebrionis]
MSLDARLLEAARKTITDEAAAVAAAAEQLDESFLSVFEQLMACTGKVFVVGSGTSGAIARRMAHLLSVCGTPAAYLAPMDALHGTMGVLAPGDIMMTLSKGGETTEINDLIELAKRRDVKIIAITSNPESTMAGLADTVVVLHNREGADPGNVIAMGSTLVTAVWGDALAILLMRQRGYTWEQMLETHPGGAVGKSHTRPSALDPIR